jgi:hypothetical protein
MSSETRKRADWILTYLGLAVIAMSIMPRFVGPFALLARLLFATVGIGMILDSEGKK